MRGLYKILLLFLLACQDQNVLGSKIINGTTAGDDLMKYMVSVQEDDEHICGGFLVSKHFVVTHGGCKFDKKGKVMVVLGTYDLSKPGNKRKEHIISTCKLPPGIGTDIMLIEINSKKPEDLPEKNQLQDPDKDLKEKCQVAGWAPVDNNDIDHVDQLHVVDVTVISPKACKVQIPGLRANAICTGGEPTTDKGGFCKRDAGGTLVCKGKAVGIATVNDNCSFPGLPNVYINISEYRSWINRCIEAKKCLKEI
ncbi:trypsin-1-like isoform X2 [Gymnodraco acuticeps]|uniref:Trypsin-1-like isoform X2 n=1 Tax=Gymnodraco acuticeps TaxID=8218 RepID=A0A6P8UDF0_GYMAC|nr:trypsin-1-like isoform X2 [Gymnodraco acuticeps]